MINQQLLDYINQQLISGISQEMIKKALLDSGWQENDIDDAMSKASNLFTESIKPVEASHILNKKVLMLVLAGVLIVGSGALGYFYYEKNKITTQPLPISLNPSTTKTPISNITPSNVESPAPAATETPISATTPSIIESPAPATPPPAVAKPIPAPAIRPAAKPVTAESWVIVFTHRGTPMPDEVVNLICNTVKSNIISWINRELSKYQIVKPFDDIICLYDQILFSEKQISGGEEIIGEGVPFTNPINDSEARKFLENKIPSIVKAKYATVFHYLVPTELMFANHVPFPKYDFEFITTFNLPDGKKVYHPPITDIDTYSQELVHEFMHKLGATDKYYFGEQAQGCKIDPATGRQYDGYDIMCHRISVEGIKEFATPKFSELIISEATAQEIKNQKIKETYLGTSSIAVISPNGGEIWRSGETHRIKWNSKGISSIRIYIYNSKVTGSGSTIYITPDNQPISAALGYYDWTIPSINQLPSDIGENNYKIIIEDMSYPSERRDESDLLFNIIQ